MYFTRKWRKVWRKVWNSDSWKCSLPQPYW